MLSTTSSPKTKERWCAKLTTTVLEKTQNYSQTHGLICSEQRNGLQIIRVVPLSIAHMLGFRQGWLITAVNGRAASMWDLGQAISACFRNKEIALQVQVAKKGSAKIYDMPCQNILQSPYVQERNKTTWEKAGIELEQFADADFSAIYISKIKPASRAEKAGFRLMDRIIYINSQAYHTLDQLFQVMFQAEFMSFCVKSRCGNVRFVKQAKSMLLPEERVVMAKEYANEGEDLASAYINSSLNGTYTEIRNIILPSKKGGTEIDHILVGPGGIFVVETKTLAGHLRGGAEDHNWTKTTTSGTVERISNPVRQNRRHVEALRAILQDMYGIGVPIYGVVVFVGCDFKVLPGNAGMPEVSTLERFCKLVKSCPDVIDKALAERIVRIIKSEAVDTFRYH